MKDRLLEINEQLVSIAQELTNLYYSAKDLNEWSAVIEVMKQFHFHGDILANMLLDSGSKVGKKQEIANEIDNLTDELSQAEDETFEVTGGEDNVLEA